MTSALQVLARHERELLSHSDRRVSTTPGQRTEMHCSIKTAFKGLRNLARKADAASRRDLSGITGRLAKSRHLHLAAVIATHRKQKRGAPLSFSELLSLRDEVSLYRRQSTGPQTRWLDKTGGDGARPVTSWDLRSRIRQNAVLLILRALSEKSGYDISGQNPEEVLERMQTLWRDGYRYFVSFDIKNFFESVGPQHICPVLPLPKDLLLRNCFIEAPRGRSIVGQTDPRVQQDSSRSDTVPRTDQLCLPQGAATSPYLATAFLQKLLTKQFGTSGPVMCVLDDIAVGGRSLEEAIDAAKALIQRLEQHPAGRLSVHKFHAGRLTHPMKELELVPRPGPTCDKLEECTPDDFVIAAGRQFQLDKTGSDLRVGPTPKSVDRARSAIADTIRRTLPISEWQNDNLRSDAERRARAYIVNWIAAFRPWQPNEAEMEELDVFVDWAWEKADEEYRKHVRHRQREIDNPASPTP